MTKTEARNLADKYGMEILRNPITSEAWALYTESPASIPELDRIADSCDANPYSNVQFVRTNNTGVTTYKMVCPTSWFDLWGWVG